MDRRRVSGAPTPASRRPARPPTPSSASVEERPSAVRVRFRWFAPWIVRRYPREVPVPALVPVGSPSLRATTVLRMRPLEPADALERVREERAHVHAERRSLRSEADPRWATLVQEEEGVERLELELVGRRTRLWEVTLGFVGEGRSAEEASTATAAVREDLLSRGFRFHGPHHRSAQLLGVLEGLTGPERTLLHPLPEEGLAALLPLWEDHLAEPGGVLVGLHRRHGVPVLLDRFRHPSHSSAIFGQTGSGKTYASALLWTRLLRMRPDLSVFVIDPLGGLAEVVAALGGSRLRVAAGEVLRLNPLDPATAGGDPRAKAARVVSMFRALFPSLRDEEAAVLDATLSRLYEAEGGRVPLLSDLHRALSERQPVPTRLLDLLSRATEGSLRGLDRPTSLDVRAPLLGFDLSPVTADELPFFLMLILDLVYGEVRRRPGPKLLVLDEAHYLARSGATAGFLDHLVRHLRHFRAGIELLSQNPEDFLRDDRGRSIVANLDHVLLLRLRDGGEELAGPLGLRPEETAFLREAALPGPAAPSEGLLRSGSLHLPVTIVAAPEEDAFLREAFRREVARDDFGRPGARAPAAKTPFLLGPTSR